MTFRRSHILTVFFSLKRNFWVLLLPVIRAVLLYGTPPEKALAGFAADLIPAGLILLGGIVKHRRSYLAVTDDEVAYKSGLILKKSLRLKMSELSCIRLTVTPFTSLFGCCKAELYTEAAKAPAIVFYADERTAAPLAARRGKTVLRSNARQNLLYSFLNANGANGLLKMSALLSAACVIMGKGMRDLIEENAALLPERLTDIPPLTAAAAAVLFLGWLVSAAAAVLENADFSVKKAADSAVIRRGIFLRRRCVITDDPAFVVFSQNYLAGGTSVYAFACGTSNDRESSPLIPYAGRLTVPRKGKKRLFAGCKKQPLRCFILAPACFFAAAVPAAAAALALGLFGGLNFVALLLPLPFLRQMLCGMLERRSSGVSISTGESRPALLDCFDPPTGGYADRRDRRAAFDNAPSRAFERMSESGGIVTAVYRSGSKKRTAVFSKERCGMITLSQNLFQKRAERCGLRFFLPASGKEKIKLRQLPVKELTGLFSAMQTDF